MSPSMAATGIPLRYNDAVRGRGTDAFFARDNAREIQRIGGTDRDQPIIVRRAADFTQPLHGVGQRELFA
jgi:hypothetical protein